MTESWAICEHTHTDAEGSLEISDYLLAAGLESGRRFSRRANKTTVNLGKRRDMLVQVQKQLREDLAHGGARVSLVTMRRDMR